MNEWNRVLKTIAFFFFSTLIALQQQKKFWLQSHCHYYYCCWNVFLVDSHFQMKHEPELCSFFFFLSVGWHAILKIQNFFISFSFSFFLCLCFSFFLVVVIVTIILIDSHQVLSILPASDIFCLCRFHKKLPLLDNPWKRMKFFLKIFYFLFVALVNLRYNLSSLVLLLLRFLSEQNWVNWEKNKSILCIYSWEIGFFSQFFFRCEITKLQINQIA